MKRIQFLLFMLIILSVAAKVSVTPGENKALVFITDDDLKADKFFRYRVNPLQFQNNMEFSGCSTAGSRCCRA